MSASRPPIDDVHVAAGVREGAARDGSGIPRGRRRWQAGAVVLLLVAFAALALTTPTALVGSGGGTSRDVALFVFGLGMACTVTAVTRWKGRGAALVWFLYAGLLWPVALIHALVMGPPAGAPAERSHVDR